MTNKFQTMTAAKFLRMRDKRRGLLTNILPKILPWTRMHSRVLMALALGFSTIIISYLALSLAIYGECAATRMDSPVIRF
jgi:hypothetical protein